VKLRKIEACWGNTLSIEYREKRKFFSRLQLFWLKYDISILLLAAIAQGLMKKVLAHSEIGKKAASQEQGLKCGERTVETPTSTMLTPILLICGMPDSWRCCCCFLHATPMQICLLSAVLVTPSWAKIAEG
jgi:hypothetical protein